MISERSKNLIFEALRDNYEELSKMIEHAKIISNCTNGKSGWYEVNFPELLEYLEKIENTKETEGIILKVGDIIHEKTLRIEGQLIGGAYSAEVIGFCKTAQMNDKGEREIGTCYKLRLIDGCDERPGHTKRIAHGALNRLVKIGRIKIEKVS